MGTARVKLEKKQSSEFQLQSSIKYGKWERGESFKQGLTDAKDLTQYNQKLQLVNQQSDYNEDHSRMRIRSERKWRIKTSRGNNSNYQKAMTSDQLARLFGALILATSLMRSKQTTLKTLIKRPDWRKTIDNLRVMGSVWVVYGYHFFFPPIQDPYIRRISQATHIQPVS